MNDPVYQEFFNYCANQKGLSENTILSYKADLKTFEDYLSLKSILLRIVKVRDIDLFLTYLVEVKKNKPSTVVRKVATLRAFYKFLYRIDEVKEDIMQKIDAPRQKKSIPGFLSDHQQQSLIQYFETRIGVQPFYEWIHKRNKALVLLLLETGLRVSEACNLKIEDLNFEQKVIHVMGKGGKEAEVFFPDRSIKLIKEYILKDRDHLLRRGHVHSVSRDEKGPFRVQRIVKGKMKYFGTYMTREEAEEVLYKDLAPDQGYVFMRHSGKGMSTRHAFAIIYRAGKALGLRIHPHMLRHTFATNMRRKGADLQLIQEALRHSSIITTAMYAHIASPKFKQEMSKYLNDNEELSNKNNKPKLTVIPKKKRSAA